MTLRIPSNQNDSILWPYRSALAWRWGFREKPEDDTCLGDMKDRRDDTVVQEGRNRWNVRIIYWKATGSQLVYSRYERNIWDPCLEGNKPRNELWDMGTETTSSSEWHKAKDTKEEKKTLRKPARKPKNRHGFSTYRKRKVGDVKRRPQLAALNLNDSSRRTRMDCWSCFIYACLRVALLRDLELSL